MRLIRVLGQRLRSLLRRGQRERELESEIALHMDALRRELVGEGMSEADAAREARKRFGSVDKMLEECRDERRVNFIEDLARDARFALRMLRKSPGFTLTALASLTLGIGANAAIFQFFEAVRLRPLPVERPDELMNLQIVGERSGNFRGRNGEYSYAQWDELRRRQTTFSGLIAYGDSGFNLAPAGEIRGVEGLRVSGNFFNVLGVRAQIGRVFNEDDDRPGCGWDGAVVSHAFWQREFGGERKILSRTLTVDGHAVPIVGVTPVGFFGVEVGRSFDVALPICTRPKNELEDGTFFFLSLLGRLRPGVTEATARQELRALSPALFEATLPQTYRPGAQADYRKLVLDASPGGSGKSEFRDSLSRPLDYLLGMVGLVLLLACANLSNMMLARATSREHEFAVRRSMGATQGRLIQQVLVESLMLSAAGAFIGLMAAPAIGRGLVAMLNTANDRLVVDFSANTRVVAFSVAVSALATILFGLAPALRAARTAVRGATEGRTTLAFRRVLLGTQVALSMVLVSAALLFARSFWNLHTASPGFDPNGVLVAHVFLAEDRYPQATRAAAIDTLAERIGALPGVSSVARSSVIPMGGSQSGQDARLDGSDKTVNTRLSVVSERYFATMKTPLVSGRDFSPDDSPQSTRVAVVNEEFAREHVGGGNIVGRTVRLSGSAATSAPTLIVGIVGNSKYAELTEPVRPILYLADRQREVRDTRVRMVIRATGDLGSLSTSVRRLVGEVDPQLTLRFTILRTQIDESVARERLMTTLTGAFGVLGIVLALTGVFGVTSFVVSQRYREFGVRMAIGAAPSVIVRLILGEIAWVLLAGVAIGGLVTLAAGAWLSSFLYGVNSRDTLTLLSVTLLLGLGGLMAGWIPAVRASRVNPVKVLRLD